MRDEGLAGHKFVSKGLKPDRPSAGGALRYRIDLAGASGRIGDIMEAKFQIFLILLAVLAGTVLLAKRINTAPAILLLLAGIAMAFVPGVPSLELPPELVLLLVLPPLIYSASVAMSWREFKSNLRPIILLAVGCVIFTAFAVAAAARYLIAAAMGRRLPAGRHRRPAGRGGAARDRAQTWACRGGFWSCSRAKDSPTTPPR